MAMTGFFYTFKRPRTAPMMSMLKYDPIGTIVQIDATLNRQLTSSIVVRKKVLFLESKKRK